MATLHLMVKVALTFVAKHRNHICVTPPDPRRYELRAEMFKALAHPMRLILLEKLNERPRCVCELAAEVGIEKSVASKHLAQLKDAGIIEDEKHGTLVEYHLVAPCVITLGACAEKAVVENRKKRLAIARPPRR